MFNEDQIKMLKVPLNRFRHGTQRWKCKFISFNSYPIMEGIGEGTFSFFCGDWNNTSTQLEV
jgi:hypothetical protein